MARLAAVVLLAAVFGLNVYRAVTQSLTVDEAYCYQSFIGIEPFGLLNRYAANLHVLHTFASWVSVQAFGFSEIALRLPSLAGCILYLIAVYRIAARTTWWAVPLLVANALIEDHMSVSRGYGLALACFAFAFSDVLREPIRLTRVAVFLALSVAANLTFLFAAAGLVAALMWQRRSLLIDAVLGPFVVVTVLMISIPFSRIVPGALYYGADNVPESVKTLLDFTFGDRYMTATSIWIGAGAFLGACILAAIYTAWKRTGGLDFFAPASFVIMAAASIASHVLLAVNYPFGRTGLYIVFMALLCLLPLARWKAAVPVIAGLSLLMAWHIQPRVYQEWSFDASTRDVVRKIAERHKPGDPPVKISCPFPLGSTVLAYRTMYHLDWISEVENDAWRPGFDYYVLGPAEFSRIRAMNLHDTGWALNPNTRIAVP